MMQVKYCTFHRLTGLRENYYFFKSNIRQAIYIDL